MKAKTKVLLALGWLSCWVVPLRAQQPAKPPAVDRLIKCGDETVVVREESDSKNGRYALGWTLRPKGQQPPVDWSEYNLPNWQEFQEKYHFGMEDSRANEYDQLFGILDLVAKKFVLLPNKFRGGMMGVRVAWSDNQQGTQYAIVTRGGRYTWQLWLVRANGRKIRATNLVSEADKSVKNHIRKYNPDLYGRYYTKNKPDTPDYLAHLVCYFPQRGAFTGNPERSLDVARDTVTLPFTIGNTRSEYATTGSITFSLPEGEVIRVRDK